MWQNDSPKFWVRSFFGDPPRPVLGCWCRTAGIKGTPFLSPGASWWINKEWSLQFSISTLSFFQWFDTVGWASGLWKKTCSHYQMFCNKTRTSTQPDIFTLTFRSLPETFIRRSLFSSSSGSCHDRDVTWHEIGRTCGSACSCPRPRMKAATRFLAMSHLYHGKNLKKSWTNFFW